MYALYERFLDPVISSKGRAEPSRIETAGTYAYTAAERIYRRVVAVAKSALGDEHPRVAQSLEAYADLLNETNRQERAQELSLRANAIRAKHSNQ